MRRLFLAAPLLLGLVACQTQVAPDGPPVRVLFFNGDSAALEADAQAVVRDAAESARAFPQLPVTVRGFAGPAGGQGYNQALSAARAQAVADQLTAAGVARNRIAIRPRGPVPFESMPTESRRVEIQIGG